ncbi:hypothetical protein DIPPA_28727 [Diplonema papillatum]|nr:hypothetical protein DIPPA_28727 [Diplonema papillatum]
MPRTDLQADEKGDKPRLLGPWYCWQHAKMLGAAAASGGTAIESSTRFFYCTEGAIISIN